PPLPFDCPGRGGGSRSGGGSGGAGSFGSFGIDAPLEFLRARARGVEILADAIQRLAWVARREAPQLAVDAEAGAHFDVAGVHPRVEAVERAHGRSADAAA